MTTHEVLVSLFVEAETMEQAEDKVASRIGLLDEGTQSPIQGFAIRSALSQTKVLPERVLVRLLGLEPDLDDTRSEVVGARLPNGDLLVGVFPRDDEYLSIMDEYEV